MKSIIVLSGPTAAGKTALAMALAERYPIDLINVDSCQVYRGLDIGSAKPDATFLAQYPHALIDVRAPEETYSAADFIDDAKQAIEASMASGRWPLLVGGTALYIRGLLYGLDALPSANPEVREAIQQKAQERGWEALHAELMAKDPSLSKTIKATDRQRIQRALEIIELTGQPPSALFSDNRAPVYHSLRLVVTQADRASLHQAVAARLEHMLNAGFIDEVEGLMRRPGLSGSHASVRSVGYRQIWTYLEAGGQDFEALRESILAATRQLAKRQLTALRKLSQALWYDSSSAKLVTLVGRQIDFFMERAGP